MKLKKIIVMCMTCLFCTSICLSNITALEQKGPVCDPYSYYKPSKISTKYVINKVGQTKKETTGYIVNVLSNCTTTQKYVSAVYSVGEYDSYSEKAI